MLESFFFDSEGIFQWAGVAAFISFLAFISGVISIVVSVEQGKKTRKVNATTALRIEELKEIRGNSYSIIHTGETTILIMDEYYKLLLTDNRRPREEVKIEQLRTAIKNNYEKIDQAIYKIFGLLYRETTHGAELMEGLYKVRGSFNISVESLFATEEEASETIINMTYSIRTIAIKFDKYFKTEFKEIEKHI